MIDIGDVSKVISITHIDLCRLTGGSISFWKTYIIVKLMYFLMEVSRENGMVLF